MKAKIKKLVKKAKEKLKSAYAACLKHAPIANIALGFYMISKIDGLDAKLNRLGEFAQINLAVAIQIAMTAGAHFSKFMEVIQGSGQGS